MTSVYYPSISWVDLSPFLELWPARTGLFSWYKSLQVVSDIVLINEWNSAVLPWPRTVSEIHAIRQFEVFDCHRRCRILAPISICADLKKSTFDIAHQSFIHNVASVRDRSDIFLIPCRYPFKVGTVFIINVNQYKGDFPISIDYTFAFFYVKVTIPFKNVDWR